METQKLLRSLKINTFVLVYLFFLIALNFYQLHQDTKLIIWEYQIEPGVTFEI